MLYNGVGARNEVPDWMVGPVMNGVKGCACAFSTPLWVYGTRRVAGTSRVSILRIRSRVGDVR